MKDVFYVYFVANYNNKVLYIGITSNLEKRIWEHKNKMIDGFTKDYNVFKLVYFEVYSDSYNAISREKQLKNWSRKKKDFLVNKDNSAWADLSLSWYGEDPSTTLGMTKGEFGLAGEIQNGGRGGV